MKYAVINVYDREIVCVGSADTMAEAKRIMRDDFVECFLEYYDIQDFENGVDMGDIWDIGEEFAWLNKNVDYDWQIVKVY